MKIKIFSFFLIFIPFLGFCQSITTNRLNPDFIFGYELKNSVVNHYGYSSCSNLELTVFHNNNILTSFTINDESIKFNNSNSLSTLYNNSSLVSVPFNLTDYQILSGGGISIQINSESSNCISFESYIPLNDKININLITPFNGYNASEINSINFLWEIPGVINYSPFQFRIKIYSDEFRQNLIFSDFVIGSNSYYLNKGILTNVHNNFWWEIELSTINNSIGEGQNQQITINSESDIYQITDSNVFNRPIENCLFLEIFGTLSDTTTLFSNPEDYKFYFFNDSFNFDTISVFLSDTFNQSKFDVNRFVLVKGGNLVQYKIDFLKLLVQGRLDRIYYLCLFNERLKVTQKVKILL